MNKIKLACIASIFFTGLVSASTPCNGFDIKINNSLADDLLITQINLQGAEVQPNGIQKINSKTEQVFTVNNSTDNVPMSGTFVLKTISLPVKVVKIQYNLKNASIFCEHTDNSPSSDYYVSKTRLPGKVLYTIQ